MSLLTGFLGFHELPYIPETKEDLTFIDVLKVANSNIKLFESFKYSKQRIIFLQYENTVRPIEEKIDQFVTDCKEVKKFVMRSLRGKLSELLPAVSMEEDILDNILGYMNPLAKDANVTWKFVETTKEEKAILTSIFRYLSKVDGELRHGVLHSLLFYHPFRGPYEFLLPLPSKIESLFGGDQLQKILAEISDGGESMAVGELKDQGGQD